MTKTASMMRHLKLCVLSRQTRVAISCSTLEDEPEIRIRTGKPVSASGPICQDPSSRLPNLERKSISTMSLPDIVCQTQFAQAQFQRTGSARRWSGTFFTAWPTQLSGSLAKSDHKRAERMNQELQETLSPMFQSEAAIDYACNQDRVLRENFLQAARSHPEKVLPPELEEIFELRELGVDEPEDETETARALSEREAGAPPTTPQPGAPTAHRVGTALRHAGARREATRFALKELRCPTCEARPLTPRPGMLPRCSRFKRCIGIDLVDLEVRNGISARALNVVCWTTGLHVVQELWNGCTAHAVMSEF